MVNQLRCHVGQQAVYEAAVCFTAWEMVTREANWVRYTENVNYSLGRTWPAAVILDVCCRCYATNNDGYTASNQVKPSRRN